MPNDSVCETVWIHNPSALIGTNLLVSDICVSNNINAFTRATLIAFLLGALMAPMTGAAGLVILLFILFFLYGKWLFAHVNHNQREVVVEQQIKSKSAVPAKEGFQSNQEEGLEMMTSPGATIVTRPTANNPFMNILLDEIKYNPTRPPADSITDVGNQVKLDDYFRVQWTNDPTDVFGRTQGQRQFYTMPSTSIPNDQGSYQNWLYLIPGKTCKEGGRDACVPGTNGGAIPWLSKPN